LLLAAPAYATDPAIKLAAKDCTSAPDNMARIAGCTVVIDAGDPSVLPRTQAYTYRGLAYAAQQQTDQAIADFSQAIGIDPMNADAFYGRARMHYLKDDYQRAVTDFTTTLALHPSFAEAYDQRGNAYDDMGKPEKAMADYNKALAFNPDFAAGYFDRGFSQLRQLHFDGAIGDFDRAIALEPRNGKFHMFRGRAYYAMGKLPLALSSLDRALTVEPTLVDAHFWRGWARDTAGNYDGALADFDIYLAAFPKHAIAYFRRASVHMHRLMLDETAADLRRALAIDPTYGEAQAALDELVAGRRAFEESLKAPAREIARYYLGEVGTIRIIEQLGGAARLTLIDPTTGAREMVEDARYSIALHRQRQQDYGAEIRKRGFPNIAGKYMLAAGKGCRGEIFNPRALFAAGGSDRNPVLTDEVTISQTAHDTLMEFDATIRGQATSAKLEGVAVGQVAAFRSPLGFNYWGTIRGGSIEVRFSGAEIKGAIGGDGTLDEDLRQVDACVFTLTPK
jgi:tetratricopeptide (TPR) repeat protein